jgi:hypothetical protein
MIAANRVRSSALTMTHSSWAMPGDSHTQVAS